MLGIGGCFYLYLEESKNTYLAFNEAKFEITPEDLRNIMNKVKHSAPVLYRNKLYWASEISKIKIE
ncbi:MAG: hypothetical protein ACE5K4_07420 [Candidatus Hydrothermarchaeota archaeon]